MGQGSALFPLAATGWFYNPIEEGWQDGRLLSTTDLVNIEKDIRTWGGDVNGGGHRLYNVALDLGPGGPVISVFGRTGTVLGQAGDYTADMVTYAVDTRQSYVDPSWLTLTWPVDTRASYTDPSWLTLTWGAISGVPTSFPNSVYLGGALVATRPALNFIQGPNATLTVSDNSASDWVDITVDFPGIHYLLTPASTGVTTTVGIRPAINVIEGSNVSISMSDDPANNRVEVVFNSTGGGSGGGGVTTTYLVNGGIVGQQNAFNLIAGTNTTIAGVNNTGANQIDVTITASGGQTYWQAGSGGAIYYDGGAVGVGTASPATPLEVHAGSSVYTASLVADPATPFGAWLKLDATAIAGGHFWQIGATGGSAGEGQGKLSISDGTAGVNRLVIDTVGQVGIGTANPAAPVHIASNQSSTATFWSIFVDPDNTGGNTAPGMALGIYNGLNSIVGFALSPIVLQIPGGGNVGIGTPTPNRLLTLESHAAMGQLKILGGVGSATVGISLLAYDSQNQQISLGAEFDGAWIALDTSAIEFIHNNLGAGINVASGLTPGSSTPAVNWVSCIQCTYAGQTFIGTQAVNAAVAQAKFFVHVATDQNLAIGGPVNVAGAVTISVANDAWSVNTPLEIRGNPTCFLTGNVGIGTPSPTQSLNISKPVSGAIGPAILFENDNGAMGDAAAIQFTDAGQFRGQLKLSVDRGPWGVDFVFLSGASGTTEIARVCSNGNVGIGTANPQGALHVTVFQQWAVFTSNVGSVLPPNTGGVFLGWNYSGGAQEANIAFSGSSLGLTFSDTTGGAWNERMRISGAGHLCVGGSTAPSTRLEVIYTTTNPTAGQGIGTAAFHADSIAWGLYMGGMTNGTYWLQVQRSDGNTTLYPLLLNPLGGNVGIGTTNPQQNLSILSTFDPSGWGQAQQLSIGEPTNNNGYRLVLGYAVVNGNWAGVIQTYLNGSAGPLLIGPGGGNIGIFQSAPSANLHIGNDLRVGNSAYTNQGGDVGVARNSSPGTGVVYFGNSGGSYLYWDGGRFNLQGGPTFISGNLIFPDGSQQATAAGAGYWAPVTSGSGIYYGGPIAIDTSTNLYNSAAYTLNLNGSLLVQGVPYSIQYTGFTAISDVAMKANVRPFHDGLAVIERIRPVLFEYNGLGVPESLKGQANIGVIAQELREVAPYMVLETPQTITEGDVTRAVLGTNLDAMPWILCNAICELAQRIEKLEEELKKWH